MTIVFPEQFWRGTRYNVVCPEHGKIGKSGVRDHAEQIAIDHEVEVHFKLPVGI